MKKFLFALTAVIAISFTGVAFAAPNVKEMKILRVKWSPCPGGSVAQWKGVGQKRVKMCYCPKGTAFDVDKGQCLKWYGQTCKTDADCHTTVGSCIKGYSTSNSAGYSFGSSSATGYANRKVCANIEFKKAWRINALYSKINRKKVVIKNFRMGSVRWIKVQGSRLKRWNNQPVNENAHNITARKDLCTADSAIKKFNMSCSIIAQGLVDKNWKGKKAKTAANQQTQVQYHLRLGAKRRAAAILWVRKTCVNFSPQELVSKEVGVSAGKDDTEGEWRKVEFTVQCSNTRVPLPTLNKPPHPGRAHSENVYQQPKSTTIINNAGAKEFSHYAIKVGMFSLGALMFDHVGGEFSLTFLVDISWEFVEKWQVSFFAGGMFNAQYAPSDRYLDLAMGGALGYLPFRWLELRIGFLQVSYALHKGVTTKAYLISRTFFGEVQFVLGPKTAPWAFTAGALCSGGWAQREYLAPSSGGACAAKLGFRLRFGKQFKK